MSAGSGLCGDQVPLLAVPVCTTRTTVAVLVAPSAVPGTRAITTPATVAVTAPSRGPMGSSMVVTFVLVMEAPSLEVSRVDVNEFAPMDRTAHGKRGACAHSVAIGPIDAQFPAGVDHYRHEED